MWKVYKFLFFVCCIASFATWFSYMISPLVLSAFVVSLCVVLVLARPSAFDPKFNKGMFWMLLLCVASILAAKNSNVYGYINSILCIFPIYIILQLKPSYQKDLLETIIRYFAILFSISWLFWFLHICGVKLPYEVINMGADVDTIDRESQYRLYNYYFFIANKSSLVETVYTRFCAIFIEPGYTGCLLSILLFLGRYRIKERRNIIFLIALISTFSLAGYLITLIGYALYESKYKKHRVLRLLLLAGVIIAGTMIIKNYQGGDNWFNYAIIERLEFDESMGQIEGYNRSEEHFSNWFWNDFVYGPNLFFGESQQLLQSMGMNNVDWKMYVAKFGLFAICFYMLYLFSPYLTCHSRNKYYIGIFTIIFALVFAQTIFYNFSLMYLSLFVLGVSVMRHYNFASNK